MPDPLLTIYVPTLKRRAHLLARLLEVLQPQVDAHRDQVELIIAENIPLDEGGPEIGTVRQRCLESARGEFVCGIDDDDLVHAFYVPVTLHAIRNAPGGGAIDCVGWKMRRFSDGRQFGTGIHSITCGKYHRIDEKDQRVYLRTPNHLNPIRRELALRVGFKNQSVAEDYCFAVQVFPLLEREAFIDEFMYDYLYRMPGTRDADEMSGRGSQTDLHVGPALTDDDVDERAAGESPEDVSGAGKGSERTCARLPELPGQASGTDLQPVAAGGMAMQDLRASVELGATPTDQARNTSGTVAGSLA